MEAKDLRPLNYFQDKNGKVFQLKKIEFEEDENDFALIYGIGTSGEYLWSDEAKPIKLTKKWMQNLGFKIKEIYPKNELHPKGWIVYERGNITITDDFRWNGIGKGVEIKYVHKLQNFYYVMEGEDIY